MATHPQERKCCSAQNTCPYWRGRYDDRLHPLVGPDEADAESVAQPGDVVINEIGVDLDGPHFRGDFIELRNTSGSPVDMGGWSIFGCNTTDSFTIITFPTATVIAAGGLLFIASNDYTGFGPAPDFSFLPGADLEQAGGGVVLLDASGLSVDSVQWGNPHPDCANFEIISIIPNGNESIHRDASGGWFLDVPSPRNS